MTPLDPLRRAHDAARRSAAMQLRLRMSGDDPSGRAQAIWGSPGERWFTPDDPIWRVHAGGSMYLAGVRALVLQALHPVAMAGVVQNSTYRNDPWARLQQISSFIATTTYGSAHDAERLMARVRGVHRRVAGQLGERCYRASDPDLLTWVHCAEIDSFLDAYQRFAPVPLDAHEADRYVAQTARIAAGIAVPNPPMDVAQLRDALDSYRPVLVGGSDARDVVAFLRRPVGLSRSAQLGYGALFRGAIATLPDYARDLLGISWSPGRVRAQTWVGSLGVRGISWMLSDPLVRQDRRTFAELGRA